MFLKFPVSLWKREENADFIFLQQKMAYSLDFLYLKIKDRQRAVENVRLMSEEWCHL